MNFRAAQSGSRRCNAVRSSLIAAKPCRDSSESTRPARRTFVSAGGDRLALGFCTQVSLGQLAAILTAPDVAKDLKIQRALNLDGGSSSAFWFADEGKPFSIPEQKTVRDFVAIVPK